VGQGCEPNARLYCRKKRDSPRGSPRSLATQKRLARDDNQTDPLPDGTVAVSLNNSLGTILLRRVSSNSLNDHRSIGEIVCT